MRELNIPKALILMLTFQVLISNTNGGLTDYLNGVKTYFGYDSTQTQNDLEGFETKIPYEVGEADQKFISQAIELTGVAVSDLDACQHRLILKLKSDCHVMNDMQISKLAVGLLNCQSYIEGRKVYPCTEEMSLKACTSEMDADVWNSYHLMTNRAKAVCYSIRQTQFRGLTEHTVNRLMETSQKQLHTLGKISKNQEDLQDLAENTIEFISKGNQELATQQQDLQKAQLFGQLQLEDNINKLADEKRLIVESQRQLAAMTKLLQEKLSIAAQQIEKQSFETNHNHDEVIQDLVAIQEKAQNIFQKIDESSVMLFEQTELAAKQYQITLDQLKEMNSTVSSLVVLVGGTKKELEERLQWIVDVLGGTDDAIERLYVVIWHLLFLIVSMIASAFMNASFATRFAVICTIPANLGLSVLNSEHAASPQLLAVFLVTFIIIQTLLFKVWDFVQSKKQISIPSGSRIVSSSSTPQTRNRYSFEDRYNNKPDDSLNLRNDTPPRTDSRSVSRSSNRSYRVTPERSLSRVIETSFTETDQSTPFVRSRLGNLRHNESADRFSEYLPETPSLSLSKANVRALSRTPNSVGRNVRAGSKTPSSLGKTACMALTKQGTPCANSALAGRDVCYPHSRGSSVMRQM